MVFSCSETAQGMSDWFDENIEKVAFRLELHKTDNGVEQIRWHGIVDGENRTFNVDPYTGFWRRFGMGLIGILPIESQL